MPDSIKDKAAIVGMGYTDFSTNSGRTTLTLAVQACMAALEDAGVSPDEVDGVATYMMGDSASSGSVAKALGLKDVSYYIEQNGGGSVSQSVMVASAQAIAAGFANYILVWRSLNSRSGVRYGQGGRRGATGEAQFQAPYGYNTPPQHFAMWARAHMNKYGTTNRHLAEIGVVERRHASKNPRARMRDPITVEDVLNSRVIAEPFHLLDCCLESDGACAVLLTSAERARNARQKPVYIMAGAFGGGNYGSEIYTDWTYSTAATMSKRLYAQAGVGPRDIDFACFYDCFSFTALVQLEDYGFCSKGEAGPFVEGGQRISIGGEIPINPHGGFLSEAYIHAMNHVISAVEQLRGEAGERQVPGAEVALVTGQPGISGMTGGGNTAAIILRR